MLRSFETLEYETFKGGEGLSSINISMLDKADVLRVLYDNARTQSTGVPPLRIMEPMTKETASKLLLKRNYFDYVNGRVLKVNLSNIMLDTFLYNRDNGQEAAEKAIATLRDNVKCNTSLLIANTARNK